MLPIRNGSNSRAGHNAWQDCLALTPLSSTVLALLLPHRAQRQEITSLRQALAETQDVMLKGKQTYNQVMHTKDLQIAQVGAPGLCV